MRTVSTILTATRAKEGAGFYVRRPFPTAELSLVDPFLLLDHMEPSDLAPGRAKGAPNHPHRGFETVTYMLEGGMEHRDSAGNVGRLNPGDVQWMTAGSGVLHSELPSDEIMRNGGRLHGFQIWVNLPRKDKLIAPRYQDTPSAKIPTVQSEDGSVSVKIVAGKSLGREAVIETRTPILYLHVKMKPNATFEQPVENGFNAFAYVIEGKLFSNDRAAQADQLVLFNRDGGSVQFTTKALPADFLLLAGQPLNEPVARYGPFVMNTKEEIVQAIDDFNSGRFGEIAS